MNKGKEPDKPKTLLEVFTDEEEDEDIQCSLCQKDVAAGNHVYGACHDCARRTITDAAWHQAVKKLELKDVVIKSARK